LDRLIEKSESELVDILGYNVHDQHMQDKLNLRRQRIDTSAKSDISELKNFFEKRNTTNFSLREQKKLKELSEMQ